MAILCASVTESQLVNTASPLHAMHTCAVPTPGAGRGVRKLRMQVVLGRGEKGGAQKQGGAHPRQCQGTMAMYRRSKHRLSGPRTRVTAENRTGSLVNLPQTQRSAPMTHHSQQTRHVPDPAAALLAQCRHPRRRQCCQRHPAHAASWAPPLGESWERTSRQANRRSPEITIHIALRDSKV
jgi:hypothetical protein